MSLTNYPPLIDGKIPAFVVTSPITQSTVINVPYLLNKAVSLSDYTNMAIMIKTVTTGTVKISTATDNAKINGANTFQRYASFEIPKDGSTTDKTIPTFTPIAGNYYKVQIAFKNGDKRSPWSSVGVIKCTAEPTLSIVSLTPGIDNPNPTLYVGEYTNTDVTEKLYSYCFTIYDENNKVYETSGDLIHNGSTDENISGVGVKSTVQWQPQKALSKTKRYGVTLKIETINGYIKQTASYRVKAESTVDANIPALLLADPDYDNGRVRLSLVKPENLEYEKAFTGNFVITRYTKSKNSWNEVCRFNMLSQCPSDVGILWTDYTLEHGEQYLYALQAYNSNKLYSNRQYHVLKSSIAGKYLHYDEFGEPYYIIGDFEDMFLTDGERQLKIKFDPKVSTFKPTILENKLETIGSKYPFIFRNGNVNYKEFAISGLISHLMDDDELFMQGIKPPEDSAIRSHTPAAAGSEQSKRDFFNTSNAGSLLTSDNFFRERQFKTAVLDWLTNGQPKLLRSPGEGSYIVQLMNTSLSPNDTLGRMLHSFNSTAYEVAECNFNNLSEFKLLSPSTVENRTMKFMEVNLHTVSNAGGTYSPGYSMYHVYITNVTPGTIYNLIFADAPEKSVSYRIGITGSLYLDMDTYPITSITLVSGDYNHTAKLHYGYYDASVPDHFSYINKIISSDEVRQVIGYDEDKNIITDKLEDIRREISGFYNITIRPRNITTVYKSGSNYYRDASHLTMITTGWSDLEIYYEGHSKKYYSGYPGNNISLGDKLPNQYFKFNDLYILDLSTGNAYLSTDPLTNVIQPNPSASEKFMSVTNGSYQVVGDIGEIRSIHLSPGVYVDLAYDLKEIEYTVESLNSEEQKKYDDWVKAQSDYDKAPDNIKDATTMNEAWNAYKGILTTDVKKSKADWQKAQVDYKYTPNASNLSNIVTKYNDYITDLQTAINLSYTEDGYYVL